MFAFLKHLLSSQNQFASGGLLLMVIGSMGVFLRSLPEHLWSFLERQTTMTITVKDDDAAFQWVKEWFLEQNFLKRVRRVDLDTTLRGSEMALIPAPGVHFFWHQGRPFWVRLTRSEDTKGQKSTTGRVAHVPNSWQEAAFSQRLCGGDRSLSSPEGQRGFFTAYLRRLLGMRPGVLPSPA